MDGKAQALIALAVLLIVAAVIVYLLSDDDVARLIALLSAILGGVFAVAGIARARSFRTQGPGTSGGPDN